MKKKMSFIMCVIVLIISMFSVNFAYAHEMYYNGSTPIVLRWDHVSGSTLNVLMSDDLLDAPFTSHYSIARNAWPNALANASTKVTVTDSSFSNSNLDLATASEDYWQERWGPVQYIVVLGVCNITSTDGILIDSASDAASSSKKIRYAGILFNPYESAFADETAIRYTMVHEIGHAFGLGHPNDVYYPTEAASVMRTYGVPNYYTPQAHDVTDMNNKY